MDGNNKKNIPVALYEDEAVHFIANRYHATPRKVVQCFLVQEGIVAEPESVAFRLEDNEMEILRGLIDMYCSMNDEKQKNIRLWTEEIF